MRQMGIVVLLLFVVVLSGCVAVTGPYYLESEQYEAGIQAMREQLRENPNDAASAYYLGRYSLALNKPELGLTSMEKAVALEPDNAEYVFWSGVAYWATLNPAKERAAYLRTLAIDPEHVSANLYLGHGYLDEAQWTKALWYYDKVLTLDKYNPEALYNRATVLNGLDRAQEEIAAWKKFLEYYPDGSLAMKATQQLNQQGDFTYRNFILGQRNVTLRSLRFKKGTTRMDLESKESLHVIKSMLNDNNKLFLHIVAYVNGDKALAKARAEIIQGYMLNLVPGFDEKRLPLSWFDTAEEVEVDGKTYQLDDSVRFISVVQ